MLKFITKLNRYLSASILNLSAALLAILTLLVFYQVITRFVFGAPSTWSEITARVLMVWMVYLSMSCVFREGSMITISFFVDLLPDAIGIWVKRAVLVVILLFLTVLIWYGWEMAMRVKGQNVAMLNISAYWLYISIPVGALLTIPAVIGWHCSNVETQPDTDRLEVSKASEV